LLVDGCPGVTDMVVLVFCNGQSDLHKLSVNRTEVTPIGIRFAIEHLSELEELDCDNDSEILKIFRRIRRETREFKKYSLTNLSIWNTKGKVPYEKGSVSLMVDMCPSLANLSLRVNDKEFTNEEFLGKKNLK
jgi:hypothetical protein